MSDVLSVGELIIMRKYAHLIECTLATYEWMGLRAKSAQPKGQMLRHESLVKTAIVDLHPQLVLALLRTKDGVTHRLPTRLLTILGYIDTLGLDRGIQEYFNRTKQNA